MLIFAKRVHDFNERPYDIQGDYRAHYVNRFRDLLRAVQYTCRMKFTSV